MRSRSRMQTFVMWFLFWSLKVKKNRNNWGVHLCYDKWSSCILVCCQSTEGGKMLISGYHIFKRLMVIILLILTFYLRDWYFLLLLFFNKVFQFSHLIFQNLNARLFQSALSLWTYCVVLIIFLVFSNESTNPPPHTFFFLS